MAFVTSRLRANTSPRCAAGALPALLFLVMAGTAHGHAEAGSAPMRPGAVGTIPIVIAHGCGGESGSLRKVDRVAVLVPPTFTAVRPRRAAGWNARVARTAGGTRIEWRATAGGGLAPRFAIVARLPSAAGTYALPTVQYCGRASIAWIQRGAGAERPAPIVVVRGDG